MKKELQKKKKGRKLKMLKEQTLKIHTQTKPTLTHQKRNTWFIEKEEEEQGKVNKKETERERE